MNRRSGIRFFYVLATLGVFPFLMGAEGRGCAAGGDVPVGSNGGGTNKCGASACENLERTLEARICPDGTAVGRNVCAEKPDGTCFWDFEACPAACSQANCAGLPVRDDAKVCPDGTTFGRSVCAKAADGRCDWDFPACPVPRDDGGSRIDGDGGGTACTLEECMKAPALADAKLCPDGSYLVRTVCSGTFEGGCYWDFPECAK